MPDRNRRLVLAERPTGPVDESTIRLEDAELPELGPGQALVRNRYVSIDPTIRTWMDDVPGYLPPIGIGEVIRSGGIGEIERSNSDKYQQGDMVFGLTGWQDYSLADEAVPGAMRVLPGDTDPGAALSVFGLTGLTAYFGLLDVGRVQEGDAVVVSGAAGATGSVVGQIARIKGASKVVGIAGSPEKCAWIVDELGFDEAINYKTDKVSARLREACPEGIDLYFDNVGGELLDTALGQLALRGRVVLCGAISSYNDRGAIDGPKNYRNLIPKRGRMQGFIILDYAERYGDAQAELGQWVSEGKIKFKTHIVEGLEKAPDALNMLFSGGNTGKLIVKVD